MISNVPTRSDKKAIKTRHAQASAISDALNRLEISSEPIPFQGREMGYYLLDELKNAFAARHNQPLRLPEEFQKADDVYAPRGVEILFPYNASYAGSYEIEYISYGKFPEYLIYKWITYVRAHPLPYDPSYDKTNPLESDGEAFAHLYTRIC